MVMPMFRKLLCLLSLLLTCLAFADPDSQYGNKQENPDLDALREWIRNKRMVTVKEIGGDLAISGEVRTEMQATDEKKNSVSQRGRNSTSQKPIVAYDVEFNLMLDYRAQRSWATVKLEFDNDMGTVSGTTHKIALERCYCGGRFLAGETVSIDGEIGRRNLNDVFDSKIEFSSLYDGILVKFSKASESIGDFYLSSGIFLVNDLFNHYGYVNELGFLRIGNTGFYTKYSIIDWMKDYKNPLVKQSFHYLVSQIIFGYQSMIPRWNKFIKAYTGFLLNHVANRLPITNFERANYGGYVGLSVGQIRKKGDWAFDGNFQYVAAQAIPDFDVGGIKRGNADGIAFYSTGKFGKGTPNTIATAIGNCNYIGGQFEFLYAFTGNLTLLNNFQISRNLNSSIGPQMKYMQYEIEVIFAF